MYKSGYIASVRQGSQTLKEDPTGKVIMPFGEEYELRLRNKNGRDCVAFVYIDGKCVVKNGLILRAHTYVDLERYVEDLNSGRRFKFVPLEDSRVKDKGEPENGIIEVRFHEEKDPPPQPIVIGHHCHSSYCYGCGRFHCSCVPCSRWFRRRDDWDFPKYGSVSNGGSSASDAVYTSNVGSALNMSLGAKMPLGKSILRSATMDFSNETTLCSTGEAGATVEGSVSSQKFGTSFLDYKPEAAAAITLKLVGVNSVTKVSKKEGIFCPECGTNGTGRYCTNCGEKLR